MSFLVTFYWLELVRRFCKFKRVRKCRRPSIILGENSVSVTRSMGKDPIRSGTGCCCWISGQKFGEISTRKFIQKSGRGKQEESLVWQGGVPWSPQPAEFSFWSQGWPGAGADRQDLKVTFKGNCSTLLWSLISYSWMHRECMCL